MTLKNVPPLLYKTGGETCWSPSWSGAVAQKAVILHKKVGQQYVVSKRVVPALLFMLAFLVMSFLSPSKYGSTSNVGINVACQHSPYVHRCSNDFHPAWGVEYSPMFPQDGVFRVHHR